MKNTTKLICLFLALSLMTKMKAQLSGTYNVPGTIPSIAVAINSLNTLGVSGPVVIDITPGYTEVAPVGGYSLNAIVGASAANTITFQKAGPGANPLITAYTGTATPASATQDGVWRLIGSDYIIIDGIDISDPNVTNPATMEFGYALFRANAGDGCQFNTIKNCVITLNRINNATSTAPAVEGSRGIDMVSATSSANTSILTPTAAAGTNSNNKFYGNTIQNCNVGIALIGFAAASPFTLADTGNDVGGTSVSTGNTIINFGGGATTSAAAGIRTLAQYGINVSYNVINNNNGAGVSHATDLRGIYLNTATSANASITNNTVTITRLGATGVFNAIQNASGSTAASNTITIANNIVTNCTFTTATSSSFNGILNSGSAAVVNVVNNLLSSCTLTGTGTFTGIDGGGGTTVNLLSNTVTSNSQIGSSATFYCMRAATASVTVNGNIISNNGITNTSGTSGSSLYGFYDASSPTSEVYTNNTINNLTISGSSTSTGHIIYGLYSNSVAGSNKTMSGNMINTFSIANSLAGGTVAGIYNITGATNNFFKNKVYDLSAGGAAGAAHGIFISSGVTNSIYNNIIGDIKTPASNATLAATGIYINGGTTSNIYYNTVLLNSTSTGTAFGSAALYASTAPNVTLRNNILTNLSTPTGTGASVAYRRSSTTLTTYQAASNNNLFYAGTPGPNNLIFSDGTVSHQTLGAYVGLVTPRDAASITENPPFASTVGSNTNFLDINPAIATQIESGGQTISGITDDFAGTLRNVSLPDIGAWEGTFLLYDVLAPTMSGSGFTTLPCTLSGRTFTAAISDAGGVASGGSAPRIYYKLNAGAYTSVAGVLTSGTANNGVWTFNLTYAAAVNDIVSYYLVVQDVSAPANLAAFPGAGFSGSNVNSVTTPPTTPNTYAISTLNGVYTVGSAGTFTSLTAAAFAYNNYCLTGPVTFSLTSALYSTAETFPIVFLNNPQASATNSLLIVPASGLAVSITPTNVALNSGIKFLNARNITIDGINSGGTSLTLNNPNVSSASANIWLASSTTGAGNTFISVKNMNLNGGYNSGSNGIIASIDGAAPSGTGGADNDDITISGNTFLTFFQGVLAVGTASVSGGGLDNWVITNNVFGPVTSGTNNLAGNGVVIAGGVNMAITGNTIQNISATSASGFAGININSNNNGFLVSQNTIKNITSSAAIGGVNAISGVIVGNSVTNGTISANNINTISNTNTSGYSARGINVNTTYSLSGIYINNNFISDLWSFSDASNSWWVIGIALEGASGGINVDNNSVNIFRSFAGRNAATGSAAMFVNSTGGAINIRNNIFTNTFDNTTVTTDINYGIYSGVSNTVFSSIDYNDYYVAGLSSVPVLGYLTSNRTTLAALQTGFGGNVNSKNIQPVFNTTTDLHMQLVAGNVGLDNMGTPIPGITIDIDNQSRNATTPDMGADEYTIPACNTANGGVLSSTSASACAGQTLAVSSTGVSGGVGTSYLWKVSTTPGGPYSPVSGGTGSTTTSYTSAPLPTGVYYVVLETVCAPTSQTATSNQGTLTVNAVPTASASSTTTLICSGANVNLTGTSDFGTSFSWTGPNSFTSLSQNPSITNAPVLAAGNYSLIASANSCSSAPSVVSVSVNLTPNSVTLTPASGLLCSGVPQALGATAGPTLVTFNFGSQVNQNTAVTTAPAYPAPYTTFYGGQRMQMLILASELTAAGFVAGAPLTSIQFPVVSMGSNWPATTTANQNFQINIGHTALATMSAFQSGLTNVVAPANFLPAVGYNNTHNFSAPFYWNGTSNVIIETTFSNNMLGTANDLVVQYNTPTSFQSAIVYRADNQTAAAIAANNTITFPYSARPDFKLNSATPNGVYSWSPSTGLSATSGPSVIATPPSNITYSVVYSVGTCTSGGSASYSLATPPNVTIAPSATAVCVGSSATLTAGGANSYTWTHNNISATVMPVFPANTTTYSVTGVNQGCAPVSASVTIVVDPLPVISVAVSPTFVCAGMTTTLTASGGATYSWSTTDLTPSVLVAPTTNTFYSVVGTSSLGCSSTTIVAINPSAAPVITVVPTSTTVCANSPAAFAASGASTYSWMNVGAGSAVTVTATANTVYTVVGTNTLGCEGVKTVTVTAKPLPGIQVTPASATVCPGETLLFTSTGAASYTWEPTTFVGNPFSISLGTTTVITVAGTGTNACKGSASVTVIVDICTNLAAKSSFGNTISIFPNPSSGMITADFGFEGEKEITIMNSLGSVVSKITSLNTTETFDLSGMAKGIYFVRVSTKQASADYKIIIQ